MIDAGRITVDVLAGQESKPGDIRVKRMSLTNERRFNLMDSLAKQSNGGCRNAVPEAFRLSPCAHLVALDAAERAAAGITEEDRRVLDGGLAERALMLEALLENVHLLIVDASRLASVTVSADALGMLQTARTRFSGIIKTLLGFNLVTSQVDMEALGAAHDEIDDLAVSCGKILEDHVFGMRPLHFFAMSRPEQYWDWANASMTPAALLVVKCRSLSNTFGTFDCLPVPEPGKLDFPMFADEIYYRLRNETNFEAEPVYNRRTCHTGALVREAGHPLVRALCETTGCSSTTLFAARLLDAAALWAELSHLGAAYLPDPYQVYTLQLPETYGSAAYTLTAWGLMTHAAGFKHSRSGLEHYHALVTPAEWMFAPEGPGQQALESVVRCLKRHEMPLGEEDVKNLVRLALFGFDPCTTLDIRIRPAPKPEAQEAS